MLKSKITTGILGLLILVFSSQLVFSQGKSDWSNKTPEEKTQKIVNSMTIRLNLTNDQASSIYDIVLPAVKQVVGFKQTSSESDYKVSVDKIIIQTDTQIQSILNQEQYQKLQEWKKEMIDRYKERIYNNKE